MQKIAIRMISTAMCIALFGIGAAADSDIFEPTIELLETEKHVSYVSGYTDGTFLPSDSITRAEVASMFNKLLKQELANVDSKFSDVPSTAWYANPVNTLAKLKVVNGRGGGLYAPLDPITRAEFVSIVAKFLDEKSGEKVFPDVAETHWAYDNIYIVSGHGLITGYTDGSFLPERDITRAEVVSIINNLLNRPGDPSAEKYSGTKKFTDVKNEHWAYIAICEAATEHQYELDSTGKEIWEMPENYIYTWESTDEGWKFKNITKNVFETGFRHVDGLVYYFDPTTELLQTGWTEIDGLHYFLPTKGEDIGTVKTDTLLTDVNREEAERNWKNIKYITVHYTGAPDVKASEWAEHFRTEDRNASAHYFVDEKSIWQIVEDKDISWHSVTDKKYFHETARNSNSIGIEMCCRKIDSSSTSSPLDQDWYFLDETESNTVKLVQSLMKTYGIPIENVIRHSDITHKACPAPYVNNYAEWQKFLVKITENSISYIGDYPIKIMNDDVDVYAGPGTKYAVVGIKAKGDLGIVYEEKIMGVDISDRWARIGSGEWIQFPNILRQ